MLKADTDLVCYFIKDLVSFFRDSKYCARHICIGTSELVVCVLPSAEFHQVPSEADVRTGRILLKHTANYSPLKIVVHLLVGLVFRESDALDLFKLLHCRSYVVIVLEYDEACLCGIGIAFLSALESLRCSSCVEVVILADYRYHDSDAHTPGVSGKVTGYSSQENNSLA